MLDVFLTIDTEFWCRSANPTPDELSGAFDEFILGVGSSRNWGANYQAEVMNHFGVKASYFLEALCAPTLCGDKTRDFVSYVRQHGHDIEIHIHAEWLPFLADESLPATPGKHMRHFSRQEQATIIAQAVKNLHLVGVAEPCAFRAGNFGANWVTLQALADNGIQFDTSYNCCYFDAGCAMQEDKGISQPVMRNNVYEFPVAVFRDTPGHYRPLHLQACSFAEIKYVLESYAERGWKSCVLVSHSFETLNSRRSGRDAVVCRRLEKLCKYLSEHPDKYRTIGFSDIGSPDEYCNLQPADAPQSNYFRTVSRHGEQALRRLLY